MKNEKLFNHTVAILVKAYQNDTLEHRSCMACAVGNIVAANMGYKFNERKLWDIATINDFPAWDKVCVLSRTPNLSAYNSIAKKQIDSTGYHPRELALIEYAFDVEHDKGDYSGFNGLMSVIDCLMEIHEATTTEAQEAKELFVKPVLA